ncbi:MAG: hypothetical protein NUW00_02735 [Candidatus Kaiserbacteria bacterium]|nr:hypothetical protein [Candidatus Kaiserbacteria bacterium]
MSILSQENGTSKMWQTTPVFTLRKSSTSNEPPRVTRAPALNPHTGGFRL